MAPFNILFSCFGTTTWWGAGFGSSVEFWGFSSNLFLSCFAYPLEMFGSLPQSRVRVFPSSIDSYWNSSLCGVLFILGEVSGVWFLFSVVPSSDLRQFSFDQLLHLFKGMHVPIHADTSRFVQHWDVAAPRCFSVEQIGVVLWILLEGWPSPARFAFGGCSPILVGLPLRKLWTACMWDISSFIWAATGMFSQRGFYAFRKTLGSWSHVSSSVFLYLSWTGTWGGSSFFFLVDSVFRVLIPLQFF